MGLYTPAVMAADTPKVLLVHGWGGHAGQMLALAQAVAAEGFTPVLLEMPAHGRSAGTVSNASSTPRRKRAAFRVLPVCSAARDSRIRLAISP